MAKFLPCFLLECVSFWFVCYLLRVSFYLSSFFSIFCCCCRRRRLFSLSLSLSLPRSFISYTNTIYGSVFFLSFSIFFFDIIAEIHFITSRQIYRCLKMVYRFVEFLARPFADDKVDFFTCSLTISFAKMRVLIHRWIYDGNEFACKKNEHDTRFYSHKLRCACNFYRFLYIYIHIVFFVT